MPACRSHHRTSLAIGWEAARANLVPGLFIQMVMLALLAGYYLSPTVAGLLNDFAALNVRHGFAFVVIAAVAAGALLPELFLIVFFQHGRPLSKICATCFSPSPSGRSTARSSTCFIGAEAAWLGNVVTLPVVLAKICIDQFAYNPFFAAPFGVLTYEWKNTGFSFESLVRGFTWRHYRDKIVPTLLATWAVWIPLMAIIYSLPLALQFPIFSLALTFWVLLLTYMTNSFATKHTQQSRIAHVGSPAAVRTIP